MDGLMDFGLFGDKAFWNARERVEEEAYRVNNAQAQDLMRALALLYREMAEEFEDSGLFERRFPPLDVADFADCEAERTGQNAS